MTKQDKEFDELKVKLVKAIALRMDNTQFDTTLLTEEGVIVNSAGIITGVQKCVYSKKNDTRKYLFEINKQFDKYRIVAEDNIKGIGVIYKVNSMAELDELLKDNNPFRDVLYTFIGDKFKN